MYSFYPGPSQINSLVPDFMQEACQSGILSVNHRSPEFVAMSVEVKRLLQEKLEVPENYSVFFVSSATECWEIIAESLIVRQSTHIYNGAFGEKWMKRTALLGKETINRLFHFQKAIDWDEAGVPLTTDTLCLTSCETSNGTQLSYRDYEMARAYFPDGIIAVDATSSMGGVSLPWEMADVWYASVQKCMGLPAGMALMICSPEAIERALELNQKSHYNSVVSMFEQAQNYQTTYTPNVLNIYLLKRVLEASETIQSIENKLLDRYEAWKSFFKDFEDLNFLIKDDNIRSRTVLPVATGEKTVEKIKSLAKAEGFLLGNGYGEWKKNSFRIANFPSINGQAIEELREFFIHNFK